MLLTQFVRDEYRLLTFRAPGAGIRERSGAYLAFGLALTCLAGIGRYWDAADAHLSQYLGLGSLAYVFALAFVLWLLVAPLRPRNWSYRSVLLFITLTAPPALLYAIPVELFLAPATAIAINNFFLAVVAVWRVTLLFVFLRRVAGLRGLTIFVAALLPLALIVDGIALMNLQHTFYETMAGIPDSPALSAETGHLVVRWICALSAALTPALLLSYGWIACRTPYTHAGSLD